MRLIIYLILVFVSFSCSQDWQTQKYNDLNYDVRIVKEIRKKVATQLNKEKALIPIGSGSQMMYGIEKLSLAFMFNKEIEIEEGRELLLVAVDSFVTAVNEDKRIHPYLKNYPFEPKNIEISIYVRKPDGSEPDEGKLSVLNARDGILEYNIKDHKANWLRAVYEESYEKALERDPDIIWDPEPLPDFFKAFKKEPGIL